VTVTGDFPAETVGSRKFLEDPFVLTCRVLRPRRDLGARPLRRLGVADAHMHGVGSLHKSLISGLYRTARLLAVYASRPRSPSVMQDSLPAAGQAWPGGIVFARRVLTRGFWQLRRHG
jgi:hypothetical protein